MRQLLTGALAAVAVIAAGYGPSPSLATTVLPMQSAADVAGHVPHGRPKLGIDVEADVNYSVRTDKA